MIEQCDVLVAGSGPAGSTAAMRLAKLGVNCLIVPGPGSVGPVFETLAPHTKVELETAGFRIGPSPFAVESYGIESNWGDRRTFHSHVADVDGAALSVHKTMFQTHLLNEAIAAGAQVLQGQSVRLTSFDGVLWKVGLRSTATSSRIRARFLIDATGRSALIARRHGARRIRLDRMCCVAAVLPRRDIRQVLSVESVSYGWWYATPFSSLEIMVGLISDADVVREIGAHQPAKWSALFGQTPLRNVAVIEKGPPLSVVPCDSSVLDRIAGEGWAAVGDAACTLDPIASAGTMKAVYSARRAADAVFSFLHGDRTALHTYGRRLSAEFDRYLSIRRSQYLLESRWQTAPFWQRRAAS